MQNPDHLLPKNISVPAVGKDGDILNLVREALTS
jgi:hypothetical protein